MLFSMAETEIQSLIAFVLCCFQVCKSLLFRHTFPDPVTSLVPVHIVSLHQWVKNQVHADNAEKRPVAAFVQWRIVYL